MMCPHHGVYFFPSTGCVLCDADAERAYNRTKTEREAQETREAEALTRLNHIRAPGKTRKEDRQKHVRPVKSRLDGQLHPMPFRLFFHLRSL